MDKRIFKSEVYFLGCTLLIALILSACGRTTEVPAEISLPTEVTPTNPSPMEIELTEAPVKEEQSEPEAQDTPAFEISSSAFAHESAIPLKYSCDGENISPPLIWTDPPDGTVSFALIHDDPDAPVGVWVHWVLYNIPAEASELGEAIPALEELGDGSQHGENSWGRLDYGGPCPPEGTHRYFFKLFALDTMLELGAGADAETLLSTMEGHILAEAELMGTYTR